jgi:hypothetical protein
MQASKTNTQKETTTMTTTETMTPYKAAALVNAQLKEQGFEKQLPPQMLYTYVSKGYIKSVEVDGKKRVTHEALTEWFVGYVAKLQGKVTVTVTAEELDSIEADNDGTVGEWVVTEDDNES